MSETIPTVEQWAAEEYPDTGLVSARAAARQLCRHLGISGQYPTLRRMLEDVLAQSNDDAREIARLKAEAWSMRNAAVFADERRETAERQLAEARAALRIIAGYEQCVDNLMSNVEIARSALSPAPQSHDGENHDGD